MSGLDCVALATADVPTRREPTEKSTFFPILSPAPQEACAQCPCGSRCTSRRPSSLSPSFEKPAIVCADPSIPPHGNFGTPASRSPSPIHSGLVPAGALRISRACRWFPKSREAPRARLRSSASSCRSRFSALRADRADAGPVLPVNRLLEFLVNGIPHFVAGNAEGFSARQLQRPIEAAPENDTGSDARRHQGTSRTSTKGVRKMPGLAAIGLSCACRRLRSCAYFLLGNLCPFAAKASPRAVRDPPPAGLV
jgi:hypothetical protein